MSPIRSKNSISLAGYSCSTAAGRGTEAFWQGLQQGQDHGKLAVTSDWKVTPKAEVTTCAFPLNRSVSMKERLVSELLHCFSEINFQPQGNYGVIFASSKGCLEDVVWSGTPEELKSDPLTPCLTEFLDRAGLKPKRSLVVSNSCASSHSALFLAGHWLDKQIVDDVLVIAADGVGAFVVNGFQCLGALSTTRCRPFAANRDGLRLGEAVGALWLSRQERSLRLLGIGLDIEGHAVTRSSTSGGSLKKALAASGASDVGPDIVIAHGTGTLANDVVEDNAFASLFAAPSPWVTCTKWSIGHTLGASGLMDIIAAAEILRTGKTFRIASTEVADPSFRSRYLTMTASEEITKVPQEILVSSLGFGGVHAAARFGVAR